LALDVSLGAEEGAKSLARAALDKGASKMEMMETLRIVNYICGAGPMYSAARALREILGD
jgi:alkylhydroperoxidase/carboxymuconolactone decarboxylase family protein YurZ